MKQLLCVLILSVAIDIHASESSGSEGLHLYTTRLKSGTIKRKDLSDNTELLFDDEELQDEDYPEPVSKPQQKKFKPMPPTPPLTATTTTQEPSQIDLLREHLKTLGTQTGQSSTGTTQTSTLTQQIEILEKQHEHDKKQYIELLEGLSKTIEYLKSHINSIDTKSSPPKTSHEPVSQTSYDHHAFKHEGSAAMILDFALGEVGSGEINLD